MEAVASDLPLHVAPMWPDDATRRRVDEINRAARLSCPDAFDPCQYSDPPTGPGCHVQEASDFQHFLVYVAILCAGLGAGDVLAVVGYVLYRLGYFLTR